MAEGFRLGPYEIVAPIGSGGMGEVYRARDTRLNRDVALKVLPEAFARDAERMARFRREAQVLASLNHPNIAAIYGFEDSGATHALVMELVEGPTLAERIKGGAIPMEEALPIAKQICEALEYAHERGIVHRDLKPANIKLASNDKITNNDVVKILDFGLAKALEGDPASMDISSSPTITRMATQTGIILGTAAYMSPEQAKGKAVDRRTDIWAFGCVLYEMLTGKMAFSGETVTDTLAAVLKNEPDWSQLPFETPAYVRVLLKRCLQKDPRQRLRDIGDARITIEEIVSGATAENESSSASSGINAALQMPVPSPRWRTALPWALIAALAIALGLLASSDLMRKPAEQNAYVAQIPPPKGARFVLNDGSGGPPAISPDGREIAFIAVDSNGEHKLWVQPLDSDVAQPLAGTEGAYLPFWSPDSRSIGYFAHGMMNRVDVSGGPSVGIAGASAGRGGAWGEDGTIVYTPGPTGGLYRVSASGGSPRELTSINTLAGDISDRWPQFLPDRQHFLFYSQNLSMQNNGTYIGSLAGGKPALLLRGNSNAVYAPPGYLLFVQQSTLMAQQFNAKSLRLIGQAEPIATNVPFASTVNLGDFSVSQAGTLTYEQGTTERVGLGQLVWYDRTGKQRGQVGAAGEYSTLSLSSDGKQIALTQQLAGQADVNIWIYDVVRGTDTKLTFSSVDVEPTWSPDGKMIAFASVRGQNIFHLYEKASDGSEGVKTLLADGGNELSPAWTPDGRYLLFNRTENSAGARRAIWALPFSGGGKAFAVLQNSQFSFDQPAVSPDGKWLAYASSQSGQQEVYVSPFLHGQGLWEVSSGGGEMPQWKQDGKELFYVSPDHKIMSAEVSEHGSGIVIGKPKPLFSVNLATTPDGLTYAVGPHGQKFLAITSTEGSNAQPVTLMVNWPALLKRQ
ncbi:MAG: protein kinase [Candidatus Acidiferrales bacterium]